MDTDKWQKIAEHVEGGLSTKNTVTISYREFQTVAGVEFKIDQLRDAIETNHPGFVLVEVGANDLTFARGNGGTGN